MEITTVNRIEIIAWREPYDDEDSLSFYPFAAGDTSDALDLIRDEFGIEKPDDPGAVDEEGCIIASNNLCLYDGRIIERDGRTFLISITEMK